MTEGSGGEDQVGHARPARRLLALVGAIVLIVAVGVGGYVVGRSSGEDLDRARIEGAEAGRADGADAGAKRGYAEGLKVGRKRGYEQTYSSAYRSAFRQAFANADLEAPQDIKVVGEVP